MRPEPRHVVAAALGVALVLMPLYILSFDPAARLDRLRTPLCLQTIDVVATNSNGGSTLLRPDSGVKANATLDGAPFAVHLTLLVREAGKDWTVNWALDSLTGDEVFYLGRVSPGMSAMVRATDPAGKACPGESNVLVAPTD